MYQSMELAGVPVPLPGASAAFLAHMERELYSAMFYIADLAKSRTRSSSISDKYGVFTTSDAVSATGYIGNKSSAYFWEENDIAQHFPNYKEGSRLFNWANNPFLAALFYSKDPHPGTHAFEQAWEQGIPNVMIQLQAAADAYIMSMFGFAGAVQ